MENKLVSPETVELLSRITGQKLRPSDVTPLVVFLAALITILLGVIFADKNVSSLEEQRLKNTLDSFLGHDDSLRPLTQQMIAGIDWHQVYINPNELLLLTTPLVESERLLLIWLGYEMSAVDNTIDKREHLYLQSTALRLGISSKQFKVIEAGFKQQTVTDKKSLQQVRDLLHSGQFESLSPVFAQAAHRIYDSLPVLS